MFSYTSAKEILLYLQELFGEHSRTARYEISKWLFCAKMREREDIGAHVNSMIRSEWNQAMQHIKVEVCAKKGEIQKFHLHSSSSNEEFLTQDPICN